ncbi:helix-turn-helix domain-containing protein [Patescibacteria group bacterium]|nr:helix-turn-helix domain-containing protein [Patescibacteria group bacterium]MBU1967431.1 helix-turn-helix domain-containing protein [Patescibacteria group bacterium]MBU2543782.1 helix-turn-helix domain-containing protein [Patescibacteria group bacterium]
MKKNKIKFISWREDLAERLKNPEFKKEWDKLEPEYQLAKQLYEKRRAKKLSQRDLAKKMKTSQAAVARIEAGSGNPTLSTLKNAVQAMGSKLEILVK